MLCSAFLLFVVVGCIYGALAMAIVNIILLLIGSFVFTYLFWWAFDRSAVVFYLLQLGYKNEWMVFYLLQ